MAVKYLYLDDEEITRLEPLTEAVMGDRTEVEIEIKHPAHDGLGIEQIIGELQGYDGLILDWRLDVVAEPESSDGFPFRAAALAQEIRTRGTEEKAKAIPIVLWSTQEKMRGSFWEDKTARDLFDAIYDKSEISSNYDTVRGKLLSLVNGYSKLTQLVKDNKQHDAEIVLDTSKNNLDIRLLNWFPQNKPVHEFARFIIVDMLERPGLLIGEALLASRLGVDIKKSPDWDKLLGKLPGESKYTGPFNEGWPRWWSFNIERTWWRNLGDGQRSISLLNAKDRNTILKEHFCLSQLSTANPIKPNYNSKFYTICEYYHRPLDPLDGVIIDELEPEPWQERRYISLDAALERRGEEKMLFPHPTEQERIESIRRTRSQRDE